MRKALTDTLVRTLPAPSTGRVDIADLRCVGLSFRVTANDVRSWNFRFRDPRTGRSSRSTIGAYPDVTLATARERADAMRRQVANGENPVATKRRERDTAGDHTFQALADRYMTEHANRHKKSAGADERNLRLHVLPQWVDRRYDDISRSDVIALVEKLVAAGKATLANRVQALVSMVYTFAMDAELVKGNPCAGMRRRGVETVGRRVLTDDEIRTFWSNIVHAPVSRPVGLALRLQLLTGTRPGEAAGAARAEFDGASWTIPAARSKNGRAHLVPLSGLAQETVRSALELIGDDDAHLFPSRTTKGAPIEAHALAVAMRRFADIPAAGKTWRAEPPHPHDLRRTVATRLSMLGVPKEDRDAVLNHTRSDVGSKHYDLHDRAAEKRRALVLWATALAAIISN